MWVPYKNYENLHFAGPGVQTHYSEPNDDRRMHVRLLFLSFHNNLYNLHLRIDSKVSINLTKNSLFNCFGWLDRRHLGFIHLCSSGGIRPTHMKHEVPVGESDQTWPYTEMLESTAYKSADGTEVDELKMMRRVLLNGVVAGTVSIDPCLETSFFTLFFPASLEERISPCTLKHW